MLKFAGIFLLFFAPVLLAQANTGAKRVPSVKADDDGVQDAIQFQRLKDRKDALQARKERLHPTTYDYSADRSAEGASIVKDPGPTPYRRHEKISH